VNLYGMVGNNPLDVVDRVGLAPMYWDSAEYHSAMRNALRDAVKSSRDELETRRGAYDALTKTQKVGKT
jgi:hypothetical protein